MVRASLPPRAISYFLVNKQRSVSERTAPVEQNHTVSTTIGLSSANNTSYIRLTFSGDLVADSFLLKSPAPNIGWDSGIENLIIKQGRVWEHASRAVL